MKVHKLKKGFDIFKSLQLNFRENHPDTYSPTPYLNHHTLQSIYELLSPKIEIKFQRQKLFFVDGGHVSLDWVNKHEQKGRQNIPIVFIMHGMTGGSDCKYIRALAKEAQERGYTCVCLNSRGVNSLMTSPIPFVGLNFHELEETLERIRTYYPNRPIHMIGTSLGGNYLLRYLLKHSSEKGLIQNIRSLSLICSPFDVKYVIHNMNKFYQKFFTRQYIKQTVCSHQAMKFWWENGIVNLDQLKKSKNLKEFHQRITCKILGIEDVDIFFDEFKICNEALSTFKIKTLMIMAKDDPMIGFESVPIEVLQKNTNIKMLLTDKGGHMCWFSGIKPQRWYPRPVFYFIDELQKSWKDRL